MNVQIQLPTAPTSYYDYVAASSNAIAMYSQLEQDITSCVG